MLYSLPEVLPFRGRSHLVLGVVPLLAQRYNLYRNGCPMWPVRFGAN
jgi:hypothetical protein